MNIFSSVFPEAISYSLGWSLIHSIWQIIVIGLIGFIIKTCICNKKSAKQYLLSVMTLMTCLIVFVATFFTYYFDFIANCTLTDANACISYCSEVMPVEKLSVDMLASLISGFDQNLSLINMLWMLGYIFLFTRFIRDYIKTKQLRKNSIPSQSKLLLAKLEELCGRLKIQRPINLGISNDIGTALTVGWLKPMILFPMCVINELEQNELESILAHELAHIYRQDFLIKILQTAVEILFYYHPVIWILSAKINEERELCCDGIALSLTNDSYAYAKALVKLQDYNLPNRLALGFGNKECSFKNRIYRILNQPINTHSSIERMITMAGLVFLFLGFTASNYEAARISVCQDTDITQEVMVLEKSAYSYHYDQMLELVSTVAHELEQTSQTEQSKEAFKSELKASKVLTKEHEKKLCNSGKKSCIKKDEKQLCNKDHLGKKETNVKLRLFDRPIENLNLTNTQNTLGYLPAKNIKLISSPDRLKILTTNLESKPFSNLLKSNSFGEDLMSENLEIEFQAFSNLRTKTYDSKKIGCDFSQLLYKKMIEDQLIDNKVKSVIIEMSKDEFLIDGEKQSAFMFKRYKCIYQKELGVDFEGTERITHTVLKKDKDCIKTSI